MRALAMLGFGLLASAACGRARVAGQPDPLTDARDGDRDGSPGDGGPGDGAPGDGQGGDGAVDAAVIDAPVDAPSIDAFPSVLNVRINCHNDCTLVANPPAINVSAGTEFEVNWIHVGDTECDIDKVDQFNQVPLIIGFEPGTQWHDTRKWCGAFTGTFRFRVRICTIASYINVNCGA